MIYSITGSPVIPAINFPLINIEQQTELNWDPFGRVRRFPKSITLCLSPFCHATYHMEEGEEWACVGSSVQADLLSIQSQWRGRQWIIVSMTTTGMVWVKIIMKCYSPVRTYALWIYRSRSSTSSSSLWIKMEGGEQQQFLLVLPSRRTL